MATRLAPSEPQPPQAEGLGSDREQIHPSASPKRLRQLTTTGLFMPGDAATLAPVLNACFERAAPSWQEPVRAILAPHAGLAYSGAIAASAWRAARLSTTFEATGGPRRVAVFSPAHRLSFPGLALPESDGFLTPLGPVFLDDALRQRATALEGVRLLERAFELEHGIETQLPFIKALFPEATILPVVIGNRDTQALAPLLNEALTCPQTLTVISSDLSHYLPARDAGARDLATLSLIDRLEPRGLGSEQACGHQGLGALLRAARPLNLAPRRLDYRHSGDTTGVLDRVVGYSAYAFVPARSRALPEAFQAELIKIARATLVSGLQKGRPPALAIESFAPVLRGWGNAFVSLKSAQQETLKGCVGSYLPHRPLVVDVLENTFKAAFGDPRFEGLQPADLDDLEIEIALLSCPQPVAAQTPADVIGAVEPDRDGLILQSGDRRALFLPSVWQTLPAPEDFIANLMRKAGLDPAAWPGDMGAWRFSTEVIKAPFKA